MISQRHTERGVLLHGSVKLSFPRYIAIHQTKTLDVRILVRERLFEARPVKFEGSGEKDFLTYRSIAQDLQMGSRGCWKSGCGSKTRATHIETNGRCSSNTVIHKEAFEMISCDITTKLYIHGRIKHSDLLYTETGQPRSFIHSFNYLFIYSLIVTGTIRGKPFLVRFSYPYRWRIKWMN